MALSRRDFVAALLLSGSGAAYATVQSGGEEKKKPVFVVAEITVKPGKREEFVNIFKGNVPHVLQEDGCIFYQPVVDVNSGIPAQGSLRENVMTVMENWASLDALHKHLKAPHMNTYREQVKDLVAAVVLKVMQPA